MADNNNDRKVDQTDQHTSKPLVVTAIQTACLALIVMNGNFMAEILFWFFFGGFGVEPKNGIAISMFLFLLLAAILNIIELMNNWASIKKYYNTYKTPLFCIDLITMGIFFLQISISTKAVNESNDLSLIEQLFWIEIGFYCLLLISYIAWNFVFLYNNKNCPEGKEIVGSIIIRFIQIFVTILFLMRKIPSIISIYWGGCIFIGICIVSFFVYNNRFLHILETIIKEESE